VPTFDATFWDERYAEHETVWGAAPNRWVEQELAELAPGTALDVACGEGRNAVWLAQRCWRVIAVDFSAVGLAKGAEHERRAGVRYPIEWVCADVTTYRAASSVDVALICYLQLPAASRRAAVRAAAGTLAPGGMLLVVGHDSRNLTDGTGGPQDPAVLFTAADLVADLDGLGLQIERADEVLRPVEGADRPAIDALLRAVRAS
jgi:SAM-dependent methyltransferase